MDKNFKAAILLNALLNDTEESIIFVDTNGTIEMLSNACARFLNVNREEVIGKHVTEVIPNTRLHIVVKTGVPELGVIQEIFGEKMIADRVPIIYKNKIIGCYGRVLFQSFEEVEKMYKQVKSYEHQLNLYKDEFKKSNAATYSLEEIISKSTIMDQVKKLTQKVANTSSTVLLLGESGTGKELFAHSIHKLSKRKDFPFIKVNCGNIPSELLESELFGYEEGSFTGAKKGGKIGKFKAADKGTIFLDEIGDLPMPMQVKLLRVLQEKEIEAIGSYESESVDVRIIAATNKNLEEMVNKNTFRSDLYYRLNVMNIKIPSLRDRKEDIPIIAQNICTKISQEESIYCEGFSPEALEYLSNYSYPGNVRELQNIVERALNFLEPGESFISTRHLPNRLVGEIENTTPRKLKDIIEEAEKLGVMTALLTNKGNRTKAAETLDISRRSLYDKIDKYNINLS